MKTLGEYGYPFSAGNYRMVLFPKGVAPAILQDMTNALHNAVKNEKFVDFTEKKLKFRVVWIAGKQFVNELKSLSKAQADLANQFSQ